MTDPDIRRLPPGPELDTLAALALGWVDRGHRAFRWASPDGKDFYSRVPPVSSVWRFAGPALEKLGRHTSILCVSDGWDLEIDKPGRCLFVYGKTAPHAVAIAWALIGLEAKETP